MNFHLKSALTAIKRSPFQVLAVVFVLAVTFFVSTVLAILIYSSGKLLTYFESRPQVIAFLKEESTSPAILALEHKLMADSRVKEVRFVSKEEALDIYKKATRDNPLLGELVNPSIFPASLEFSLLDLAKAKEVIAEVKSETIVDSVGFTAALGGDQNLGETVERLKNVVFYLRVGGGTFVALLVGTSFLVLVITLGMRIISKKEEMEILDLIGAKASFIRKPILIESLVYVFSGVFLGWLSTLILFLYLAPAIIRYFGEISVFPQTTLSLFALFGVILGVEIISGVILVLAGITLAFSRARKPK